MTSLHRRSGAGSLLVLAALGAAGTGAAASAQSASPSGADRSRASESDKTATAQAAAPGQSSATRFAEFLASDRYHAAVGENVLVGLFAAQPDGPRLLDWPSGRVGRFFVLAHGTQDYLDEARPAPGSQQVAIPIQQPGVTVIGRDAPAETWTLSREASEELVQRLNATIHDEARWQAALAAGPVSMRVLRSSKVLVRTPDAPLGPARTAAAKTGQAAEIRPLMDPTVLELPSDVALRLYTGEVKVERASFIATHINSGAALRFEANESGIANLRLDRSGTWRVEVHCLAPPGEPDHGTWTLYSSVLMFQTREGS